MPPRPVRGGPRDDRRLAEDERMRRHVADDGPRLGNCAAANVEAAEERRDERRDEEHDQAETKPHAGNYRGRIGWRRHLTRRGGAAQHAARFRVPRHLITRDRRSA
jgi:hypothetical protein